MRLAYISNVKTNLRNELARTQSGDDVGFRNGGDEVASVFVNAEDVVEHELQVKFFCGIAGRGIRENVVGNRFVGAVLVVEPPLYFPFPGEDVEGEGMEKMGVGLRLILT